MVGMQNAVWTYKNTMGIFRQGRYLLFVTAAINIVMSIWLGNQLGLFGILLATAISRACTNTWYDPYAIHKYGFEQPVLPYYFRYFVYALICAFTGGVCYYICSMLRFTLVINIILKMIICSVIPNTVFLICFFQMPEFKYLWSFVQRVFAKFQGILGKLR